MSWHKEAAKEIEENELNDWVEGLGDYATCYMLVLDFFKNDKEKVNTWFMTENPGLGDVSPISMVMVGRSKKLLAFVESRLEELRP